MARIVFSSVSVHFLCFLRQTFLPSDPTSPLDLDDDDDGDEFTTLPSRLISLSSSPDADADTDETTGDARFKPPPLE